MEKKKEKEKGKDGRREEGDIKNFSFRFRLKGSKWTPRNYM